MSKESGKVAKRQRGGVVASIAALCVLAGAAHVCAADEPIVIKVGKLHVGTAAHGDLRWALADLTPLVEEARILRDLSPLAAIGLGQLFTAAVLLTRLVSKDPLRLVLEVRGDGPLGRLRAEADTIGLELMARAGYDPRAALTLWNKMGKADQGGQPKFLSTHPSPRDRSKDIEKLLPRVLPLYNARN